MSVIYESQTALGKRLGVSRVVVGRWLTELGLRYPNGVPTPAGRRYSKQLDVDPSRSPGHVFYVWAVHAVLPLLLEKAAQAGVV